MYFKLSERLMPNLIEIYIVILEMKHADRQIAPTTTRLFMNFVQTTHQWYLHTDDIWEQSKKYCNFNRTHSSVRAHPTA
jgi:hypothetical protein